MAIKPNREGINPKYINKDGGVIAPPDTVTQSKVATLEGKTSTLETKVGNLYFRVSGDKPQYKNGESGEWSDFSSGGGVATLITTLNRSGWDFGVNMPVNSAGYTHLIVECCYDYNWTKSTLCLLPKNVETFMGVFSGNNIAYRSMTATDTELQQKSVLSSSYNAIPHRVWGVNLTI